MTTEPDFDKIRIEQLYRTEGAGHVSPEVFAKDVARMTAHLAINGEPFERHYVGEALLATYTDPIRHRYWTADGADDGTPKGRVMRLLYRMQVMLQEKPEDEAAHDWLCDHILDPLTGWPRTETELTLRRAVRAELTHGGIRDEIAQRTTIIGAETSTGLGSIGPDRVRRIRQAAEKLDQARDEFTTRMEAALNGDQHA